MTDGLRLTVEHVSHRYGNLEVLRDIDLTAEAGQVMVLVGPSGCGKSTLLGIIGGLLSPSAGSVRCDRLCPFGLPQSADLRVPGFRLAAVAERRR